MYFILGASFVLIQVIIRTTLSKYDKAKLWPNCILAILSNFLFIFSLAWAYASLLEHEIQAAMMGLLVFGGMGMIVAIIAYRIISK